MDGLPETTLQFGGGNFLRAFADLFVHEANLAGAPAGRIVVVQSTSSNRAELLNAQGGRYHVWIRGLEQGREVDRVQEVRSVSRALVASEDWHALLEVSRSPELRTVISNTTEAGYALAEADRPDAGAPSSFPAKLLLALEARYDAGLPGPTVLPCELVEQNGDRLRELVLEQAGIWGLDAAFTGWLEAEVRWRNTLVDRIVSGRPDAHPLLDEDALLTTAEPFALWVVEAEAGATPPIDHPSVEQTDDVAPFLLRKVRILNGAHTALVCKALPQGIETVREAVNHKDIGPWVRRLVFEEIAPTLEGSVEDPAHFAEQALERFANPFLEHRLRDIALHHEAKVAVRLAPTREAFEERFGRSPELLSEILADDPR
ncbi:MAG: tagaturonate reductase [Candidatus Latescibacteria bacterium]|jgi:tagaturonate reductase|nr:tagaturonate reductase [Candidatus Latescibacterota bacterium]